MVMMSIKDGKSVDRLAKKMFGIRKALGVVTDEQNKDGWVGEKKFFVQMIRDLKKKRVNFWFISGGFKYIKKDHSVYILPNFMFKVRYDNKKK